MMIVTSRLPESADSPQLAARTLARLSGSPGAIRQHLGPLSAGEVAARNESLAQHHDGVGVAVDQVVPEHVLGQQHRPELHEPGHVNPFGLEFLLAFGREVGEGIGDVLAPGTGVPPLH